MEKYFIGYYEYFKKKIGDDVFLDFRNKDNYIRENTEISHYGSLSIEIVGELMCQLKCKHCYLGSSDIQNGYQFLSESTVKGIIDQAAEKRDNKTLFSQIAFLGGEPTLHPKLIEFIHYAIKKGLSPILVTNGLKLANYEYAKEICIPGVSIVTHLPFQPISPKSIVDQNNVGGVSFYSKTLKRAWNNILKLRTQGIKVFGNFVISKLSMEYAYDTYIYCRKNSIEPFFERMRMSNDKEYNKKFILTKKDIVFIIKKIFNYDYKNGYLDTGKYAKAIYELSYFTTPIIGKTCTMFKTGLHIKFNNSFGACTSCCGQTIIHGDITKEPLFAIMERKKEIKIFSNIQKYLCGPCKTCSIMKSGLCIGGCRGDANSFYGCTTAAYPQCVFIRSNLKNNPKKMLSQCNCCPSNTSCKRG